MVLLTDVNVGELIEELGEIEGVTVSDLELEIGKFRLGMALPDGETLPVVINVYEDSSYLEVDAAPQLTPACWLQVDSIMGEYGLQPIQMMDDDYKID